MKRIVIIFAVVALGAVAAFAQNISPVELKNARLAVYQWFNDYENNSLTKKGAPRKRYYSLFVDSAYVVNEYLPYENYNFENTTIPFHSYIDLLKSSRNEFYDYYSEIIDVEIVSEILVGRALEYEFNFEKEVWFKDSADSNYEYPKDTLKYNVNIVYDIDSHQVKATSISLNEPIEEFVVLHNKESNIYTTLHQIEKDSVIMANSNVPMISNKYNISSFDSKMIELQCDTMKWSVFLGASIGNGFLGTISNNLYSDIYSKSKLNYSIDFGAYRQLMLKGNDRLGLEFGLSYRQTNLNINNKYGDRYASVDADGGSYERIIAVTDYEEDLTRFAAGLPVALRYDHFMMVGQRKRFAFSAKLGVLPKYDFKQVSRATADAQYSGYYDWLWGVTIDQNDIYDFGSYAIDNKYDNTAVDRFSLDAFAALGVSHYVTRKVSIDLSAAYLGTIYNKVNYTEDSHLTNDLSDWHSATCLMKRYSLHSINLILQMNYNF